MALHFPEAGNRKSGHFPSTTSSERSISPGHSTPTQTDQGQRSISFAEDSHPSHYSSSTAANEAEAGGHSSGEATINAQDHDRDQARPAKDPSSQDPTSSSPSSPNSAQHPKKPWYRPSAFNYHSISLENTGSVARDHLALERTFLAWLRTSLAFASIGIAITQLFRLNTTLADQKQQTRDIQALQSQPNGGGARALSLPLSPLMGASLTPELFSSIQSALQQQAYPIYSPSDNTVSTLLDQLIGTTEFDSVAAARLRHLGKPLGATFLGISIVILFIGFHRYFESQHWIIRGQFPASRGSVALTGLIAVALIVASLVVVLVVAPTSFKS